MNLRIFRNVDFDCLTPKVSVGLTAQLGAEFWALISHFMFTVVPAWRDETFERIQIAKWRYPPSMRLGLACNGLPPRVP